MVPSSVVQGRKVGGQGVFGCPPSLIRGILPLLRATQSPPGGDQRPPCKWCCPHPQPPTQETRPLRAGVRPLDPSEPAQPSLAISPECSPAGHSVKGTLSPRVYEPRSPCPAGGGEHFRKPPILAASAFFLRSPTWARSPARAPASSSGSRVRKGSGSVHLQVLRGVHGQGLVFAARDPVVDNNRFRIR